MAASSPSLVGDVDSESGKCLVGYWSGGRPQTREFDPFGVFCYTRSRARRPRGKGGGVGCKMAAGGRASPGAEEGEEMAGAISGLASPKGVSGPSSNVENNWVG